MKTPSDNAGLTMYEVLIAGIVLSFAVLSALTLIPTTSKLEQAVSTEESARMVLRTVMEDLYARSAQDAFAHYNLFGADDADGEDTAPGSGFDAPPFEAVNPDGFVGHVEFPPYTLHGDTNEITLDETVDAPQLCMPRDLDGDGLISASVNAKSLVILPVRVTLDWRSAIGTQHIEAIIILGPR